MTPPAAPVGVSPELAAALDELRAEVRVAGRSIVAAARRVRAVGTRHRLEYDTTRLAFRRLATELLTPLCGNDPEVAKAIAWIACDAAWGETPRG